MSNNQSATNYKEYSYLMNETQPMKNGNSSHNSTNTEDNKINNFDPSLSKNMNNSFKSTYEKFGIKLNIPENFTSIFKITKIGKSIGLFPDMNGDPHIIIGPQWPFFLLFQIISLCTFLYIYNKYNENSTNFIKILDWLFFIIWIITSIIVSLKNPGYPKISLESVGGNKEMSYCDKCEIWYKPLSSTFHCDICDICVEGHIRHCLLTGHCIGDNNKKIFYGFLIISAIFTIYLLLKIFVFTE